MGSTEDFFRDLLPRVAKFLYKLGAPPREVDDMTSEVFGRFFAKRYQRSDPVPLLFGIARHIVADYFRSPSHKRTAEEQATFSDPGSGPPADPVQRGEEEKIVQEALSRLPASERVVVIMHAAYGIDWSRICECFKISLSAAQGRYKRGRAKLRQDVAFKRIGE